MIKVRRYHIPFLVSIFAFGFFILASIWYYQDRPPNTIPYSYKYVQNGTLIFSNGTKIPVEGIWKIAFNFTTNDVFSAGTEVTVNAIARVEDDFPHENARIIFPSAFPKNISFYEGHAIPADMNLVRDPNDRHRFMGTTTLVWRDSGAKCIVVDDDSTIPNVELPANCPSYIEPDLVLPSAEVKQDFETDKKIGFITLIGVAITALGTGSYLSFKKPAPSNTAVPTRENKKK